MIDWIVKIWAILSSALNGKANNFEQVTVDATAGGVKLTANKYGTSKKASVTVETAQIRFRVDGGVPTTTVGHLADIGDEISLESNEDIVNFKAIRVSSTSALITVTYSN
jgi:hypothetical protein